MARPITFFQNLDANELDRTAFSMNVKNFREALSEIEVLRELIDKAREEKHRERQGKKNPSFGPL